MRYVASMLVSLLLLLPSCGGDQKSSAEREQEAQKAIEEGMQKEKRLYEGMVKGVEGIGKKAEEKSK
jgi:hypothetical protein